MAFILGPLLGLAASEHKKNREREAGRDRFLMDIMGQAIQRGQGEVFDDPMMKKSMKDIFGPAGEDYNKFAKFAAEANKKAMETSILGQIVSGKMFGTPQTGGTPAAPEVGIPPGTGMLSPDVMSGATTFQDVAGQAARGSGVARPAPQPQPFQEASPIARPSPRSLLPAGMSISQKEPVTGATVTLTGSGEQEKHGEELRLFLSSPQAAKLTHPELVDEARRRGLLGAPNAEAALAAVGKAKFDATFAKRLAEHGKTPTDSQFRDAAYGSFIETGYVPREITDRLYHTPEQQTMGYAQAMANAYKLHPDIPLNHIHSIVTSQLNFQPSQQAVSEVAKNVRNDLRNRLMNDPNLAANPAAMEAEILKRTGYLGATRDEVDAANKVAPLPSSVLEEYGIQGVAPPLAKESKRPVAGAGATTTVPEMLSGSAQERAARGAATTRAAVQSVEVAPENERKRFVDLATGSEPPTTSTRGDLDKGFNDGKYAQMTVNDPRIFFNLRNLANTVRRFEKYVGDLQGELGEGFLDRFLKSASLGMAETPGLNIGGQKVGSFKLPASQMWMDILGVNKEQAEKLIALQGEYNTALLILRELESGEKGNIAARVVGPGFENFPHFPHDNFTTSMAKLKAFRTRVANERDALLIRKEK